MKSKIVIFIITFLIIIVAVTIMFLALFNNKNNANSLSKLSIADVKELSKKGESLSWSDFEKYQSKSVGSGLYILNYEIDDMYHLMIGGPSNDVEPTIEKSRLEKMILDVLDIEK